MDEIHEQTEPSKGGPQKHPIVNLHWRVRLTIESGRLCCPWSLFHEKAEELIGSPIWTHEFGDADTNLNLKIATVALDEGYQYQPTRGMGPIETLMKMTA